MIQQKSQKRQVTGFGPLCHIYEYKGDFTDV